MKGEEIGRDSANELKRRMKELVEPDMYEDDSIFYRYLKARDFNVDQAETMLKNHLKWRKENGVKNIGKTKHPEVLNKYFAYEMLGYDKEGSPVRYSPLGNIDSTGLAYSIKEEDLMKKIICNCEEDMILCKEMTEKLGKPVEKCIHIFDLDKLTLAKATDKRVVRNAILIFVMYQNNYPETLKTCYIINASSYFSLIFAAIKVFIASSVLNKVKIYNDESYKEDLLKVIDADVLPAFLGGTRTDPDGNVMCKTFGRFAKEFKHKFRIKKLISENVFKYKDYNKINRGGLIPESYYVHKNKRPLSSEPGVKKVTLTRAAFHEIVLEVKEACSHLEWEFETKIRDIGFGLFYQEMTPDGEQKNVELIPITRIDTEEFAHTGLCQCEKAGTYVIVFDNTYSWLRSKELFYRIKIIKPDEQACEV